LQDQRFRWTERLHRKADFRRVFQQGKRFSASGLTVWVASRPLSSKLHPRMAVAISRHYGSAVARNRLKRLLRETFRLNKQGIEPHMDMVFTARPMKPNLVRQDVEAIVMQLWVRAGIWKTA
jgi:ribonuclease P protein component